MTSPIKWTWLYLYLIIIIWEGNTAEMFVKNSNNYGLYDVEITGCEICAGPKQKNVTDYSMELEKIGDEYIIKFNFTFLVQCHVDEVKVHIYSIKENKKTLLLNYKVKDPCQHYALASMLELYLHAKNCLVKKGYYPNTINISEVTKSFFGSSFFYGDFFFKATVISKQGNIFCLAMNSVYRKKT